VRAGRQLLFTAPRRVDVTAVDVPEPSPGELLVRTLRSGISTGTELLAYRGLIDPDLPLDERLGSLAGTFRYPFAYGYSCVGVVEESRGTVPIGSLVFAFHPHQDRFVVAQTDTVALAPETDPGSATLLPLVETALQISLDAGPVAHEQVVVLGLGTVGVLTALLLQRAGARVVAAEPIPDRREVAARLGVTALAPEDLPGRLPPGGVPLLVELSGAPEALSGNLALLAHEGTALVGSWYGTQPVSLPLGAEFHRRRLTIRATQVSTIPARLSPRWDIPRRRRVVYDLLTELPLSALPATEIAFEDAASAYEALDRGTPDVLHVSLRYK
jgi:2-desacetyl-2-hydroxyethyl bacteriochlorophyllide A dehydrogenase